jgi:hypothetical protein
MAHQFQFLFATGFAALLLACVGAVIRIKGPQGLVHGVGDLSKLDADRRKAIGRCSGNSLLWMAAVIAAFGVFCYFCADDSLSMIAASAILVATLVTIAMLMKRRLFCLTQSVNGARRDG